MRAVLVAVLSLVLAACASHSTKNANPDAIAATDAVYVGGEVAAYVARTLPAASSTVWVQVPPAPPKAGPSPLAAAVGAELRELGFAVAEGDAGSSAAHRVRYDAFPLDDGVLLQVAIDGELASRWYARDPAGALAPASAYTVRAPE